MISVIIPTYNRNDSLSLCLNCLEPSKQLISSCSYQVVVSDDSSSKEAKSLIEKDFPWVTWVEGPKQGPAANRNNGAKYAQGKWLVFTDDDCLPHKFWLAAFYTIISTNTDALVLEGKTLTDRPKLRFDEEAPENLNGNKLWSCNFAIEKNFFNKIGGFDETFPYSAMEDVDFYMRVKNYTSIIFVPNSQIIHPWRRLKPFKSFNKHLRSHKRFAEKYKLRGTTYFRWERTKIFAGSVTNDFKALINFSMKGWLVYIEKCALNFCLIFI